jgi:hypothetical protein
VIECGKDSFLNPFCTFFVMALVIPKGSLVQDGKIQGRGGWMEVGAGM